MKSWIEHVRKNLASMEPGFFVYRAIGHLAAGSTPLDKTTVLCRLVYCTDACAYSPPAAGSYELCIGIKGSQNTSPYLCGGARASVRKGFVGWQGGRWGSRGMARGSVGVAWDGIKHIPYLCVGARGSVGARGFGGMMVWITMMQVIHTLVYLLFC